MSENKTKYLVIGVVIVILISLFVRVNLLNSKPKEEKEKTISQEETRSMLSYTIDGEKTDVKPTKESGYIANKIICENGSNLIWDNTNWEVEIISLESNDICSVDFTTDTSKEGYRVTVTTNVEGSIDSLSKATIEGGKVVFYSDELHELANVTGSECHINIFDDKLIVDNVISNKTCNLTFTNPKLYRILTNGKIYTLGERGSFDIVFDGNKEDDKDGTEIIQGYNQEKIIYKAGDNYYFAGNPSDNWVKMTSSSDGTELWWRIIRTNVIEGTRLLYAGTAHDGQDATINNRTYSWGKGARNVYTYVYWSNINFNSDLNKWYGSNIGNGTSNDNMIKEIEYCNDISYIDMSSTWGEKGRKFGARNRLVDAKNPSYACETNQFGEPAKIGLMTADEVAYAGGVYGKNAPNTYYYRNSKTSECTGKQGDSCSVTGDNHWWTMSPSHFNGTSAYMFRILGTSNPGFLSSSIDAPMAIRPVITLKPEVKVSGSGTTDDPFIPSLN